MKTVIILVVTAIVLNFAYPYVGISELIISIFNLIIGAVGIFFALKLLMGRPKNEFE